MRGTHGATGCAVVSLVQRQSPYFMSTTDTRDTERLAPCTSCGAVVPGGTEGCRKLFGEALAREYSDPVYGAVHFLTVDAYALQHAEQHGPSTNAYHLILPNIEVTPDGPQTSPVPTGFELPNGMEQPFLHIMYEDVTLN